MTTLFKNPPDIATVETCVSRQGYFSALDWLLAENRFPYQQYEAWRNGELETLDTVFQSDASALDLMLSKIEAHCRALGLQAEQQTYPLWSTTENKDLSVSKKVNLHSNVTQRWSRPDDVMQLDIFMDNTAIITENELLCSLGNRNFNKARADLQRLTSINLENTRLGKYQDLLNYGLHMQSQPQVVNTILEAELKGLKTEVSPLAKEVMGVQARDYLSFAWRRLANSMPEVAFDSKAPDIHRSFALMQIPDWQGVVDLFKGNDELYHHPELIERVAVALDNTNHRGKALLQYCLLIDYFPQYGDKFLESTERPSLVNLREEFWSLNDNWPSHYFPAFVLTRETGLIRLLDTLPEFKNSATREVINLLKCRANQEDEIHARQTVQDISPALLRMYLTSNAVRGNAYGAYTD